MSQRGEFGRTVAVLGAALALLGVGLTWQARAAGTGFVISGFWGWVEVVGFVTGILGVWLMARQNLWTWPIGVLNTAAYSALLFVEIKHFANGALYLFFLGCQFWGWWNWSRGVGEDRAIQVTRASGFELAVCGFGVAALTYPVALLLRTLGGQVPVWDALTFLISVAAQLMTNRKQLQSWVGWGLANAISVPLFVSREYRLTAVLYAVFLVQSLLGWVAWRRDLD